MSRFQISVLASAATATLWIGFVFLKPSQDELRLPLSAGDVDTVRAEFELTDQTGMVRTEEEFRGRWMLVFFGFTNCPDICPMGLATISGALDALGSAREAVQPIFVTVDPERDTPSRLDEYLDFFDPEIIGLGGTPDQLRKTAGAFKVYYERVEDAGAPDGYTMGHSPQLLLFDDRGEFVRTFDHNAAPSEIADDIRRRMRS